MSYQSKRKSPPPVKARNSLPIWMILLLSIALLFSLMRPKWVGAERAVEEIQSGEKTVYDALEAFCSAISENAYEFQAFR